MNLLETLYIEAVNSPLRHSLGCESLKYGRQVLPKEFGHTPVTPPLNMLWIPFALCFETKFTSLR